mmetsp:Transcript_9423/g.19816  ORF Transcript_9423/g.19816 Transcript_9423/m.19816 type:complete len:134 (+) Transcript_9423:163-564(+)
MLLLFASLLPRASQEAHTIFCSETRIRQREVYTISKSNASTALKRRTTKLSHAFLEPRQGSVGHTSISITAILLGHCRQFHGRRSRMFRHNISGNRHDILLAIIGIFQKSGTPSIAPHHHSRNENSRTGEFAR